MASSEITVHMKVPFQSRQQAEIAYKVLRVDKEPTRNSVHKELAVEDGVLHIRLSSTEARSVRVSANSILDQLLLVLETLEQFGPQSGCSCKA